ncbi:hypothetical protein FOMPIDRAFT_93432 [Fomitopsis schrenkii]|uniref:Uncharacterized protein n=1 Tax=Fomitopsis schrenkii TaxID=2126942 RepID=S8DNT7_FOMSC|nr:hypothetical protein FOMPIDRAFT_93432 [Fomitopsis schrenkii]
MRPHASSSTPLAPAPRYAHPPEPALWNPTTHRFPLSNARFAQTGERTAPILIDIDEDDSSEHMLIDAPTTPLYRGIAQGAALSATDTVAYWEANMTHNPQYHGASVRTPTATRGAPSARHDTPYAGYQLTLPPALEAHGDRTLHNARDAIRNGKRPEVDPRGDPALAPLPDDILDVTMTPEPAHGWRAIQGDHPEWQLDNLEPGMANTWRNLWKDPNIHACFVMEAAHGATDEFADERRAREEDDFSHVFLRSARIIQAQAATTARRNENPIFNLVTSTDADSIRDALKRRWVSIRGGSTMYFEPLKIELPTLIAIYTHVEAFGSRKQNTSRSTSDATYGAQASTNSSSDSSQTTCTPQASATTR